MALAWFDGNLHAQVTDIGQKTYHENLMVSFATNLSIISPSQPKTLCLILDLMEAHGNWRTGLQFGIKSIALIKFGILSQSQIPLIRADHLLFWDDSNVCIQLIKIFDDYWKILPRFLWWTTVAQKIITKAWHSEGDIYVSSWRFAITLTWLV